MKITRFLAAACFVLFAGPALAASTCNVKEYIVLSATGSGGVPAQIAAEPAKVDQAPVDFTAGHAESAAFNVETKYIRVVCSVQASFAVGAAPVAVNTNSWVPAGSPEYFGVQGGQKISFVTNP